MPIKPIDILKFARTMVGDDEVQNRTASGRAHYASIHAAKDLIPDDVRSNAPVDTGFHSKIIDCIAKMGRDNKMSPTDAKMLVSALKFTKSKRVAADYYLNDAFTKEDAADSVEHAGKIINLVQRNVKASE